MVLFPSLVIPLMRELSKLFGKGHTAPQLPAEFCLEIEHDAGLHLPQHFVSQQGSPVYMPAVYH